MIRLFYTRMTPIPMNKDLYVIKTLEQTEDINNVIFQKYNDLKEADIERKSHLFHGRYENIYIKDTSIPEIQDIIEKLKQEAALFLNIQKAYLKFGFWFNAMSPGDQTTLHCHDDFDEVLSGVYYIKVPEQSGNLILHMEKQLEIQPKEGMIVLFSPCLKHHVTINNSKQIRLSIGFNVTVLNNAD